MAELDSSKTYLVWNGTTFPNSSSATFKAPAGSTIDWGDGTIENFEAESTEVNTHTYTDGIAEHTIAISGLTSIADSVFFRCSGLTSITIGNGVTSIGYDAFAYCSGLTSITIPNSVTSIGDDAFFVCSSLTSVTIPDSITTIDRYAFSGCNNLAYNEENGLKYLGNPDNTYLYLMKASKDIETVQINNRCKVIGDEAFHGCRGLMSVTIGDGVKSIGQAAFYNCTDLKNIVLFPSVPPTLDTDSIPATVSNIYVQQSSEERYKTATNWIAFAEKIQSNNIYLSLVRFNKKNKEYIDKKLTAPTNPSAESTVTMLADGTVGTKLLNDFINKPATPTADSAVTMLADGTVGTKPLSEIGGGGKLYQHDYTITGTGEGNYVYCTTYKRSNTPLTIQEVISLFSSQTTTGKVVSVGVVTNNTNGGTGYFQNVSSSDTYDVYKNGVDAEFDISASSNMTYNIVEV